MRGLASRIAMTAACSGLLLGCVSGGADLPEDEKLGVLIKAATAERLESDPSLRTKLAADGDVSEWTSVSETARAGRLTRVEKRLEELAAEIDAGALSPDGQVDYAIYKSSLEYEQLHARAIEEGSFLYGNLLEPAVDYPDILVASHAVKTPEQGAKYVKRLRALPAVLTESLAAMSARHGDGVVMMKSAYAQVANRAGAYASGAPCGGGGANPLLAALAEKLTSSGIDDAQKEALIADAKQALTELVCPAYEAYVQDVLQLGEAGRDQAAWALPNGERFYRDALELSLGERVKPSVIHQAGLEETKRIREEMRALMRQTGFEGDLDAFNLFLREGGGGSLPNNEQGRAEYVRMAETLVADMYALMPDYFSLIPETPVVIEIPATGPMGGPPSAGAFYGEAPADGSRPAYYYLGVGAAPRINTWSLASTTFHEIAPGHHHQTETFRASGAGGGYPRPFYPGYFDGWAVYTEELAREMGAYEGDIYSEIGWLQGQLTRAIRMVVDTGLNAERWSEEEANAYQSANGATVERLNRFLIWPGQGLSYYWGYLEFKRVRADAQARLGDKFDIKEFHETVLRIGPVPLSVMKTAVDIWIVSKLSE